MTSLMRDDFSSTVFVIINFTVQSGCSVFTAYKLNVYFIAGSKLELQAPVRQQLWKRLCEEEESLYLNANLIEWLH